MRHGTVGGAARREGRRRRRDRPPVAQMSVRDIVLRTLAVFFGFFVLRRNILSQASRSRPRRSAERAISQTIAGPLGPPLKSGGAAQSTGFCRGNVFVIGGNYDTGRV